MISWNPDVVRDVGKWTVHDKCLRVRVTTTYLYPVVPLVGAVGADTSVGKQGVTRRPVTLTLDVVSGMLEIPYSREIVEKYVT